jgi:hypothetical protein
MGHGDGSGKPVVVSVSDAPDTRLFIELSSYGSDLTEARHALELAVQAREDGSPLTDPSALLIGFAVGAYCRTILHSSVRRPLTDHVELSAELEGVHEQVRTFRNSTIAHSQSELSVTYPVGVLDPVSLELLYVAGMTMTGTLPLHVVHQFRMLIDAMVEELDAVIEPVRARLESELRQADPHELLARSRPEVQAKFPEEFNPMTRRPPYPRGQTLYWDQPADGVGGD